MPVFTGCEEPLDVAGMIAEALERFFHDEDVDASEVTVRDEFQPWVNVRLRNGAEFQITPVRSGWPWDGACIEDDEDDVA